MPHQDRLNIAVFIDFDNIEIGVKSTLNTQFEPGIVLDALKERGEVISKTAYADWKRADDYSRSLTQHAIKLVQRNLTPGGDKNGADINLALDALEMAFTHPHINAYVIVGGDSDFLSLVEKLKQYDKKVFVVGGRAFTSMILQRNCHEFIAYENLAGVRKAAVRAGRPVAATASTPFAQAFPVVRRALKILADREVSPQTGLLKSTLLQLDSTFSERNYGASSFLDFVEKLAQAGMVTLKHSGRSVMVELNEGFRDDDAPIAAAPIATAVLVDRPEGRLEDRGDGRSEERLPQAASEARPAPEVVVATESQDAGVQRAGSLLTAATGARWPMYLRNVKQILRAADGGFDERRYGFGGLMDLLKACQRAGFVRIERDRRGGLRVFQGPSLVGTGSRPAQVKLPQPDVENEIIEVSPIEVPPDEPGDVFARQEIVEPSVELEPIPIDTTAELLGRAKPRKPRVRAARPAAAALGSRPPARAAAAKSARKPAARRPKKAATTS